LVWSNTFNNWLY